MPLRAVLYLPGQQDVDLYDRPGKPHGHPDTAARRIIIQDLFCTRLRPATEIRDKAYGILELLKLTKLADQPAGSLSYGQRKLLEIGRVMMTNPKLVLLDEPTAGINPTLIQELVEILVKLADQGMRFFLVEHNMPLVSQLCDQVLVLDAGELIFNGSAAAARSDQRVIQAYLGSEGDVEA